MTAAANSPPTDFDGLLAAVLALPFDARKHIAETLHASLPWEGEDLYDDDDEDAASPAPEGTP